MQSGGYIGTCISQFIQLIIVYQILEVHVIWSVHNNKYSWTLRHSITTIVHASLDRAV